MEDGRPFFFEGGPTGCLLIHGFTGTTSSMRLMGEYLAERGVTCLGPRLPGHGTDVIDMGRWSYTDWTSTVETALAELNEICEKVFVGGLSMGGLLTLYLAERHSDEIAGAIPISAPVHWIAPGASAIALKFVPVLKHLIKTIPGPGNDLKEPDVTEVAYEKLQQDRFRHAATFLRWRTDKPAEQCDFAQIDSPAPFALDDIFG
jgi:carboxylesterase